MWLLVSFSGALSGWKVRNKKTRATRYSENYSSWRSYISQILSCWSNTHHGNFEILCSKVAFYFMHQKRIYWGQCDSFNEDTLFPRMTSVSWTFYSCSQWQYCKIRQKGKICALQQSLWFPRIQPWFKWEKETFEIIENSYRVKWRCSTPVF